MSDSNIHPLLLFSLLSSFFLETWDSSKHPLLLFSVLFSFFLSYLKQQTSSLTLLFTLLKRRTPTNAPHFSTRWHPFSFNFCFHNADASSFFSLLTVTDVRGFHGQTDEQTSGVRGYQVSPQSPWHYLPQSSSLPAVTEEDSRGFFSFASSKWEGVREDIRRIKRVKQ